MRSRLFRILAILASLTAIVAMTALVAWADEKDNEIEKSTIGVNPIYKSVVSKSDLVDAASDTVGSSYTSGTVYTSISKAGVCLRNQLKKRTDTVTIKFKTKENVQNDAIFEALVVSILDKAFAHTGNPTEGDYLRWQYKGYDCSMNGKYDPNTGYYKMNLEYVVPFYTTTAQEQKVTAKVQSLLSSMNLEGKSDYVKIKAIYDYITNHVDYDFQNAEKGLSHTAYAAACKGKAVCQGYAVLFYRMALEEGVDARVIGGIGRTSSGSAAHGWNIAKCNGRYYNLDPTWDEDNCATGYKWLLKSEANFVRHTRSEMNFTDYASTAFHKAYPIASSDYKYCAKHTWASGYTTDRKANCQHRGSKSVHCTVCGERKDIVFSPITDHNMVKVGKEKATCTKEGKLKKECSVCGYVKTYPIKALGHSYSSKWTVDKKATYKAKGSKSHHCIRCGRKKNNTVISMKKLKTPASVSAKLYKFNKAKVSWGKVTGATGYRLAYKKSSASKWKTKTVKGTSYTTKALVNGQKYQYKVRAIVKNSKGTIVNKGAYSSAASVRMLKKMEKPSVQASKDGKVVVEWDGLVGATGYQISRSESEKDTNIAVTIKKASVKTKKIKAVSGYYYKVRAYRAVNGKRVYAPWSDAEKYMG